MNIAVDIDDTLTESFDYFLPFVAEYFGADINDLRKRNISYSNLPDEWKKEEFDFGKKYYDSIVPNTPFKKDASWGVKRLHEMGHRVVIITGRTDAFYTDPYKTTKKELENGHIFYDKLICTLDKASACIQENIDVLIDDMPANCKAVSKLGISALLFSSKANEKTDTEYQRVANWKDVIDAISKIKLI